MFICVHQLFALKSELFLKEKTKPVNPDLIKAINFIIEEVFLKRFTTVNVISAVDDPRDPYFVNFKDALIRANKGFCIYRLDNHRQIQTIPYRLKIYNVILLDNYKSFEILYKNITADKFNFQGMFLFVLLDGKPNELHLMFDAMWKKSIINVNAMYIESSNVQLMTFLPFKPTACGDTKPHQLDSLKYGDFKLKRHQIFPNKLQNLYNCEIRLVTFHRCPAACVQPGSNGPTVTGFDIGIIDVIAERLKFTLKKDILIGYEQWGTIFHNGSTTGAIRKVVHNESDIAIGNFLLRASRGNVMDHSMVYFSFPVVFAVPLGARLSSFQKLLRPFELVVWILILITLAIGLVVILVLNLKYRSLRAFVFGTGIKNPVTNLIVIIFGGSQPRLPQRNFARFILMMFLMFCLVQRNAYQGSLYIFLQTDGRHKEVQSIDEMVQKGFEFYMYESYSDIIESQPNIYNK